MANMWASFQIFRCLALAILYLVLLAACSPSSTQDGPNCQNLTIPVTISSNNAHFPADFTPNDIVLESLLSSAGNLVFDLLIEGTFNISASYCEPEVYVQSRASTLQFLVHGAVYTRNYWSGDGAPGYGYDGNEYSWVAYASTQGYPTLAIDRLGNGLSDHPDPILVVQNPIHVEIANAIIQLARKGVSPLPHTFNKIIYVGHSIGSLIGNALNAQYPTAVDATILTGFSDNYLSGAIAVLPPCLPLPAQLVQPTRYANLAVCYLEFSSEAGDAAALFYPGGYDPSLQAFDYATRGTVTCGELLTIVSTLTEAPKYEVPIFVVTGQNDGVFCNPWSSIIAANCGTGSTSMLAQTQSLYPAASSYGWYAVPDSGHCWQLHYAAQQGFNASHTWLAEEGF